MLAGLVLGTSTSTRTRSGADLRRGRQLLVRRRPRGDGPAVRRHERAGRDGPRQQPALEGPAAELPLLEADDRRGRGLRGRRRHRDAPGHGHPHRRRGRDLRRVGGASRPVPTWRVGVPAPPPDPVHGGNGHPASARAHTKPSRSASSGGRPRRPGAVGRPRFAGRRVRATLDEGDLRAWRETEHMSDFGAMQRGATVGRCSRARMRRDQRPLPRSGSRLRVCSG
jgi:hypothetical protein